MCGVPLCSYCGVGEMCLSHATVGPLLVIRALLGLGPTRSILADAAYNQVQQQRMTENVQRLHGMFKSPQTEQAQHGQEELQSTYPG